MAVINIHHRQSAHYCDGRGDVIMTFITLTGDEPVSPRNRKSQKVGRPQVYSLLLRISEKIHHPCTISSRYKLWYGAGLVRTAPSYNRVCCIESPFVSSITFSKNKHLRSAASRLCKDITHINLLGTKWMRVGTTTRKYKPIIAINDPHAHKPS
jgi:hypothetical protein